MSQQQYFKQYAEPEVNYLDGFPDRQYRKVICIPAYDEKPDFIDSIQVSAKAYSGTFSKRRILLILVINQPENINSCERNNQIVRTLNNYPEIWNNGNDLQLIQLEELDILLVDRYSLDKKIPKKKGVGLARKIACDLAAKLYITKHISESQIYCSDADVIFPENYFSANIPQGSSAAVFNFRHTFNDDETEDNIKINEATQLYEKSLHHYVQGLHRAGSQYAYHTIGSCLLISIEHYIKARGFPKRPAGEDFYLLNKLQKLAPVSSLSEPTIAIRSRLSDRVPFGTGPAIDKLLNATSQEAKIFYHPSCFEVLGYWITHLSLIAESNMTESSISDIKNDTSNSIEITAYLKELEQEFNLQIAINKLFKTHKSTASRKKHLHEWFDGFKTLKIIHYLRDHHFSSVSYTELQKQKQQLHVLENS